MRKLFVSQKVLMNYSFNSFLTKILLKYISLNDTIIHKIKLHTPWFRAYSHGCDNSAWICIVWIQRLEDTIFKDIDIVQHWNILLYLSWLKDIADPTIQLAKGRPHC